MCTRLRVRGFCLWKVARKWSVSMRLLILFLHLVSIAEGLWVVLCIVRSHRRTHIRWIASERSILKRRDLALEGEESSGGRVIILHPRRSPRVRSGHGAFVGAQRRFVSVHIFLVDVLSLSSRMCSSDSVGTLQLAHRALCSRFGICSQKSPTRKALFRALYRRAWIGFLMSRCPQPVHIAWSLGAFALMVSRFALT